VFFAVSALPQSRLAVAKLLVEATNQLRELIPAYMKVVPVHLLCWFTVIHCLFSHPLQQLEPVMVSSFDFCC
jgi:hypothetical protein